MSDLRVGVLGLGAMGAPMASHLAAAGLLSAVWNRTLSRSEAFARQHEVGLGDSQEDLAARCNVILTCVSADPDLEEVVERMSPGLEPGDIVVDTSTVNPLTAKRLAERLAGAPGWSPLVAFSLIIFTIFYAPCFVSVVCIAREAGSWKWGAFAVIFNTGLAFSLAVTVYQVGRLFV